MIKIEDVEVMGMRKAIKGMRNAMNSWDKSDSCIDSCIDPIRHCEGCPYEFVGCNESDYFFIGKADMDLAKHLINAGSSDRKFLRIIHVQADVTAPLYWWEETKAYKINTIPNSCFPMDTILEREFTLDDFSHEHLIECYEPGENYYFQDYSNASPLWLLKATRDLLNHCHELYLKTNDKKWWWQMIQLLPSSFNQMRTIDLDYETLFSIYCERKNHELDEWVEFCKWIETLPYMKEFLESDEQSETKE